jgi:hypothetical protein
MRQTTKRIFNCMTMSVEIEVAICLDAGSTPAISIRDFHRLSLRVKTSVLKGFGSFLLMTLVGFNR